MHRHLLVLVFSWPLMAAMQTPAIGQSAGFAALEGKSISVDYREQITTPRGQVLRQTWRDRIYISTKGRIFHRFDLQSSMPGNTRTFETFGDIRPGRGTSGEVRLDGPGHKPTEDQPSRRSASANDYDRADRNRLQLSNDAGAIEQRYAGQSTRPELSRAQRNVLGAGQP